jgi:hypothetical protein
MMHGGAAVIVIVAGNDAEWLVLSMICTVNELVPFPVGVPEIIPVDAPRDNPVGKLPVARDQTTGAVQFDV